MVKGRTKKHNSACVKKYNIKLIGITSKKDSLLFKNADVKLLPNVKEAGPGNFVPIITTVQWLWAMLAPHA